MVPPTVVPNVPVGVRPNPNAVSRALILGLVGIVFATLVTVITNDVLEKLLTVNVALAKRVASGASGLTPCQVTVNDWFPFTKTLTCAEPGTTEARTSENTESVIRRVFINIPMVGTRASPRAGSAVTQRRRPYSTSALKDRSLEGASNDWASLPAPGTYVCECVEL